MIFSSVIAANGKSTFSAGEGSKNAASFRIPLSFYLVRILISPEDWQRRRSISTGAMNLIITT